MYVVIAEAAAAFNSFYCAQKCMYRAVDIEENENREIVIQVKFNLFFFSFSHSNHFLNDPK